MSDYSKITTYLYEQLPMFHRVGASAYKKDLDNIISFCNILDNPQLSFKSIHIAGTNGKGSTAHFLSSILQNANYKVGLLTSPHLIDFRERIRINGKMICKDVVIAFVKNHLRAVQQIQPSFFEWTTALAFFHFANEKVDIAIIETGLGGRLDSTNIIMPILSIITNISYDHQQFLGHTYSEIAIEKAGIIKSKTPIVIGKRHKETDNIFIQKSESMLSPLYFAQDNYYAFKCNTSNQELKVLVKNNDRTLTYTLGLVGNYQLENTQTVLQSVAVLKSIYAIDNQHIRKGLQFVKKCTGLRGRWEIIQQKPLTICDVAHNEDGLQIVLKQLLQLSHNQLHIVFGMVNDKDISKIISLLPKNAHYYLCAAKLLRSLSVHALYKIFLANNFKSNISCFETVINAYKMALKTAVDNDIIYIGGSTFVVGELLSSLQK